MGSPLAPLPRTRYAHSVSHRSCFVLGTLLMVGCHPTGEAGSRALPTDLRFRRVLRLAPLAWHAYDARPATGRPAAPRHAPTSALPLGGRRDTAALLRFRMPRSDRPVEAAWLRLAPFGSPPLTLHVDTRWGCAPDHGALPPLLRVAAASGSPPRRGAHLDLDVTSPAQEASRRGCDLLLAIRAEGEALLPGPAATSDALRPALWVLLGP